MLRLSRAHTLVVHGALGLFLASAVLAAPQSKTSGVSVDPWDEETAAAPAAPKPKKVVAPDPWDEEVAPKKAKSPAKKPKTPTKKPKARPVGYDVGDESAQTEAAPAPTSRKRSRKPKAAATEDTETAMDPQRRPRAVEGEVPPAADEAPARAARLSDPAPRKARPAQGTSTAPGEAQVRVLMPGSSRVKEVVVVLEGEQTVATEDQRSVEADSIINVGVVQSTEIGFKGDSVSDMDKTIGRQDAWFYVFSGVVRLEEFEITPTYMKKGDDLFDSGSTPPVFSMEVVELERIGDTRGRVLAHESGIAMKIGESNAFPIRKDVAPGKKVAVRLYVDGDATSDLYVQLKASKKGKYPVNLVNPLDKEAKSKVAYSADVRFSFVAREGDIDTFASPMDNLAAQINRYVERHGANGDVEVPLRIHVEYR